MAKHKPGSEDKKFPTERKPGSEDKEIPINRKPRTEDRDLPIDRKEENEQKKEFLRSYQVVRRRVRYIEDEIQRLRADDRFQYLQDFGEDEKLESYRIALEEQVSALGEELLIQQKRYDEIEKCIKVLKSDKEKEVMRLKYIQDLSWNDVMDITGWSWTHVHRLHSKALNDIKIPKKNKKILKKE